MQTIPSFECVGLDHQKILIMITPDDVTGTVVTAHAHSLGDATVSASDVHVYEPLLNALLRIRAGQYNSHDKCTLYSDALCL